MPKFIDGSGHHTSSTELTHTKAYRSMKDDLELTVNQTEVVTLSSVCALLFKELESNGSQNHNFRGFKLIAHLPDDPQVLERLALSEMSPLKTKLSLRLIYRADIIMTMLWGSCQMCKIAGCACAGNAGNVFPATDFRGNRWLAIPACITARASRTCRDACRDS